MCLSGTSPSVETPTGKNKTKQRAVCLHENTTVLTGLTQLKALPARQLLVQGTSQDAGQQQHGPAHRREVGGDEGVGHEGDAAFGFGRVAYRGSNTHRVKCIKAG